MVENNVHKWDGVDRRVHNREMWAAIDLYDAQIERLRNKQCLTDEEVFVLNQRCLECRPRRSSIFPALIWALLVALLGALCVCLADLWHQ